MSEDAMDEFCGLYNLKNMIKEPTCYKSLENPLCIDLIFTNRYNSFQNTSVIESGLSDFHKLTITVLKTFYKKHPPRIVTYRDYKHFSQLFFRKELDQFILVPDIINASNDKFATIVHL